MLAAHILLLVEAPLPDTLLSSLLSSSYPSLISHARRVLTAAKPTVSVLAPVRYNLSALLPYPSLRAWWNEPRLPKSEEEKRFDRMRWRWMGLALAGSVAYWFIWGPEIRLMVEDDDDDDDDDLAFIIEEDDEDMDVDVGEDDGEDEDGDGDEGRKRE
jgi:sorting and assembly machinery component 37